jgi:hypothetical protein
MTSYYDVDTILAEEELVPCTSLFEFNYLSELDPDSATTGGGPKDTTSTTTTATNNNKNNNNNNNYLPENSRIKIPLWVCKGWAMQGFVRLSLPRHYARKARERYDADPGDADLRYVPIVVVVCWTLLLLLLLNFPVSSVFSHIELNIFFLLLLLP